ncbi:MAG: bifunctional phosphopantothenoylcysteine decarboxylase/phosphopantothenate--cysteine ligase CoaBC [Proteobacteria bacterium]|nr:MAG: bifunctional phosphopantothenoylcysteine decarboxylase/phosphopantothenate--cysteine ligase CoaBC [Pseudomonadota bacterium]
MNLLEGKNILVCVSGSIAIYKNLELIRLFVKSGANVKVLMSEGAKRFITPLTFEAISGQKVLHKKSESWSDEYNHIKITKNVDLVVLAPASANTINKFSCGIADTLLTQTLLANKKPLLLAPSMNTNMYIDPSTQKSLKKLKKRGIKIVEPVFKKLACLDEGNGALADVWDIFYFASRICLRDDFWKNKKVLVTGGGTRERIDDVRFIGNFSSGKMAYNLALSLFLRGAKVRLLTSKPKNAPFKVVQFDDTKTLDLMMKKFSKKSDYLFMAAAVSDYKPKVFTKGKLKKKDMGKEWSLDLIQNEDILSKIDKKNLKVIGFKAEFDKQNALINAKNMLENKNLDAVCLNILGGDVNFSSEVSRMSFITKDDIKEIGLKSKLEVAFDIVDFSKKLGKDIKI